MVAAIEDDERLVLPSEHLQHLKCSTPSCVYDAVVKQSEVIRKHLGDGVSSLDSGMDAGDVHVGKEVCSHYKTSIPNRTLVVKWIHLNFPRRITCELVLNRCTITVMSLVRVTRGIPKYNIQIGPMDQAIGHNPSAILSVTDYFDPSLVQLPNFHWVPINEIGKSWGYRPFFQSKKLLDFFCLDLRLPLVYLCCSAGIHRSPMTAFCWLLSFDGATPESVAEEFYGKYQELLLETYYRDVKKGYIPPDLLTMYKIMKENPSWSYQGVLRAFEKYERITYPNTWSD